MAAAGTERAPIGWRAVSRSRAVLAAALIVALMVALAACASAPPSRSTSVSPASVSPTSASPNRPTAPPTLRPPAEPGLVWRAEGTSTSRGPATYLARTDGGAITLMWINAPAVRFRLIPGFAVPEGGPVTAADRSPSTWVPRMVAAFNGGFLLKDGVGGYYFDHQMVRAMKPGFGALEITADGRLSVGAWGRDLTLTAQTVAVRQNLPLLVDRYRAQTRPSDTASTWGVANGGLWTANRSSLGQLADGSLVFAFGAGVRPAEMAASMVMVRAKEAMSLDMNRSWPGGFVYEHRASGIVGQRIHPLEWQRPSVYYARFRKDFIAVLLR